MTECFNPAVKIAALLLLACALAACTENRGGPEAAVPVAAPWRSIATERDRARFKGWRTAWVKALQQARTAGYGAQIEAEGALLEPDAALPGAAPPAGDYRCRVIKIGAKSQGMLDYVLYPAFACRIGAAQADGGLRDFAKLSGSQRPMGRLFPESDRRLIFLGSLQLGDEQGTLRYGHDAQRDMIGLFERVGERRWRLAFPSPAFESNLDVMELVPAS